MFKRFTSMLLAVIMIIGVFPVSAMAENQQQTVSVTDEILHEQIKINTHQLAVNIGRSTEGILAVNVPNTITDADLENAYVGNPLNCTFVDFSISVPEPLKNESEIKFVEFFGSDAKNMENINIPDDGWNTYIEGEYTPGWLVTLATKDEEGNIVREAEGETWLDYGVVWSVGEKLYPQKLQIVREMPVTPGEFEGKTVAIGSNLDYFETVYTGSKVIYRYKGGKKTAEEVAQQLGADAQSSMGIVTALRIPEGYTDVEQYIENGNNSVGGWKEFAAEFTDLNGYIPLWPIGYTQGLELIEGERTFTIVWTDGNGGTFEETITVATDFGDLVPDEGDDGGEEDIPGGPRPFVERVRLVLNGCEEFFDKGRSGTDIIYTYNVEADDTREKVLERLLNNNNGNSSFEIRLDSPDSDVYTTIESVYIWDNDITSDFIDEPGERVTSLNLGRMWFTTMADNLCENWKGEFTVTWSNGKTGNEKMTYMESGINFSLNFPVLENYPWMSVYNNPVESGRIDVVNSEGTKLAVGGEAVDGLSVKGYENGKLSLEYSKPADGSEETFSVSVKAPDGAAYYRVLTGNEFVDYNPDKIGEYDSTIDWDVESIPLGANGKFDVEIELGKGGKNLKFVDGINVWYAAGSEEENKKQVAVIKWYGEGGTMDDDLYLNEYFYIDIESKDEQTLTSGVDRVTEKVTAPVIEGGSKSDVVYTKYEQNIYPANTEKSGKYYFVIETDDMLEAGEKVYIPYCFISEGMNAEKAAGLDISIRNLFGADANTSGIEYDEFGMFFYTDVIGEFVLSWKEKVSEDEERRFPKEFYEYWKDGEIVTVDQLYMDAHPAIVDYMSFEFVDEVLVVTVDNIPVENWKEVYYSLEPGELLIDALIKINPPYDDIVSVRCENGNGYAYQILKNKLYNNIEVDFGRLEFAQGFEAVAQVEVEEDEITIIPRDSGIFFASLAWKNSDGEIITQILPYEFKRAEDAETVSFLNEKSIFSGEIRTDERSKGENPIIVAEYDEESGVLKYTYNGPRYPGDPDEDIIIGEAIAVNEYGERNGAIDTIVKAPDGFERADGRGSAYLFPIRFMDDTRPLFGSSNYFEAVWKNTETEEILVETITIQFEPGKVWMENYWDGITEEDVDRIVFIPINEPEGEVRFETVESLKEYGINIDLFSKPGRVSSTFGDIDEIDINTVANLEIMILPPDATPRKEGESTEEWVNRVLNETEYKFNKEGATGVDWYDPAYADFANKSMPSHPFKDTDIRSFRENIAAFEYIDVNGIRVWFTFSDGGNGHTVFVDWYKADEYGDPAREPSVREFVYGQWEQLVFEVEAESLTESELKENGSVETPTPIIDEGEKKWKLTTNHYPQTKENENVSAYYFQLEGDENTPDGKKVVYLPYSFIDPELDYNKALDMKLKPKIHHYKEDHKTLVEGKPIDGELRPEGIRFEVESFSPFVLAWEKENHEFGETTYEWSENGKNCEAKRVCLVCEDHTETVKASVSGKKVKEPTCTEKGQTEYTAVFEADWAEEQKKTVSDIPETGHDWNKPDYEWSEDGKSCEAKRICKNDEDHTETVKASVSGKKVKEPTCTENGWTEYTAVFEADWAEDQKKIASDIPETGHRWDKGEIVEEPTCTEEGTRLHTCLNDKNHTKEEDIPVDRDAHSFGRWKTVIKATEDREGKRVKICSECGKKVYEIIPMKDGNAIIISGTEREEDEENPNTGAAAFSVAALVSVIGAAGVFLLGKKR